MRIAICDDLQQERERIMPLIREFLDEHGVEADISEYISGEELIENFSAGVFSLVFLDIYMGGMSGVETARQLKSVDSDCVIVFTTTSKEHGADAFDVNALHYIVKPVEKEKLFSVMEKWFIRSATALTIQVKSGRTTQKIVLSDIIYIETLPRGVIIHTESSDIETTITMKEFEQLLPQSDFYRPSRWCIVSLPHVRSVTESDIVLEGLVKVPVPRRERDTAKTALVEYKLRQIRNKA